jgi:hypothetical protein
MRVLTPKLKGGEKKKKKTLKENDMLTKHKKKFKNSKKMICLKNENTKKNKMEP